MLAPSLFGSAQSVYPWVPPAFALPFLGQSQVCVTCPFPSRGQVKNTPPGPVRYPVPPAFALPYSGQSQALINQRIANKCFNKWLSVCYVSYVEIYIYLFSSYFTQRILLFHRKIPNGYTGYIRYPGYVRYTRHEGARV